MNLLSLCLTLAAAVFCYITMFHFCHIFQLEGYKPREYVKWLGEFGGARIAYTLGMAVLYVAMSTLLIAAHSFGMYIPPAIYMPKECILQVEYCRCFFWAEAFGFLFNLV